MNNSPFIKRTNSEFLFALDIFIAAMPAIVWSGIVYGLRPVAVVAAAMACGAIFEAVYAMIFRKGAKIATAAVLGMTVALFMPASVNYVMIPVASFIAVTMRRFIGGVISPTAAALLPFFLFTGTMSAHTAAVTKLDLTVVSYADKMGELAAETPLDVLMSGAVPEVSMLDIFLGNAPEAIGAMSAILLLLGGIYLICRRAISWQTPVGFLAGAIVVWFCLCFDGAHYEYLIYHLCAGGILLGAFFGATEHSSAPVIPTGRLIHGVGCGALAMVFRKIGFAAESVLLAMLVMSLFSRVIDMITAERYFGYKSKKVGERFETFLPDFNKK
jgi:electron transport complex protein RnfD